MPKTSSAPFTVLPPEGKTAPGARSPDPLFATIAHVMDTLFRVPGTSIRVGLDPVLGLIPGVGDTASSLISALLLFRGVRAGLPKAVLLRMAGNVAINAAVGAIPVVGDAFSVWFKSNRMNLALYERHVGRHLAPTRGDRLFGIGLIAALLGMVALLIGAGVLIAAALWRLLAT